MAIEREQRDRMELELAGYRSAKWLGDQASWIFWDDNMERAMKAGYFKRENNGRDKVSYYYQLTTKGKAMLRKAGPGFTYGDAQGRTPLNYRQGDSFRTRWVKVSPKARREKAEKLLAAYKHLVTAEGAHDQLALEKEGWFPNKTTRPPERFIAAGYVERMRRGLDRKVSYFRLTPKGRKLLVAASLVELAKEQAEARRILRVEQAAARRRLPREIDVRDWGNFPS
jgi:DNA-binding MarR family transcriptional regulator